MTIALAPSVANSTISASATYEIDAAASRIEFSIRKRLFFVKKLTVTGRFANLSGTISLDGNDPATARVDVAIDAAGIDTGNARRDTHLSKADFFDVDRHPMVTFVSSRVEPIDRASGHYRVVGDLTVRGITREVTLETHDVPTLGDGNDDRVTITLSAPLNRKDFGIVWSSPLIRIADDLIATMAITVARVS